MNNEYGQDILISIAACKYCDKHELLLSHKEFLDKVKKSDDKIDYYVMITMVQKKIITKDCAVVLVKFTDDTYQKYEAFKIILDISMNPNVNFERFKTGFVGDGVMDNADEIIKKEGSINQMLFFERKNEEMQGCGYYSVIISKRSTAEIRNNPNNILDDVLDEFKFEVYE